ncbi:hypothetical protein P8452_08450 [Trifolium repens]|nr:hypothetical protein P8452_08450 [Trifolium repens]
MLNFVTEVLSINLQVGFGKLLDQSSWTSRERESTMNILSSRENLSTINLEIFFIQRMTLKMPGVEDDFAMSEVAEALSRKVP